MRVVVPLHFQRQAILVAVAPVHRARRVRCCPLQSTCRIAVRANARGVGLGLYYFGALGFERTIRIARHSRGV